MPVPLTWPGFKETIPGFKVVIAGAGIAGLTLALGLLKQGIRVQVLERDLTAVRGEGKLRGPIQIQSNALGALEAIDPVLADKVMAEGCITGDRINGLCDGVSGDWYCKFDTFHPAVELGLPVTRVINRVTLQQLLSDAVLQHGGPDAIQSDCHVTSYHDTPNGVVAELEDGRRVEGDVLVGTDGIWSKIRKQMVGDTPAHYSAYTVYTGISDYVPADIELVAYRVFLGNGQYFVSSDVGEGKMQWYAFHKEPPGGQDAPGQRKARLMELFGHWNYNVVDLIKATPEADVLRRDVYDRPPIFRWAEGRVALLGDSAHAMQPNLGQGGCMAIEDAHELACSLGATVSKVAAQGQGRQAVPVRKTLKEYQKERILRVAAIHGMAGMAAFMASTYKAYLGEGLGPLSWLTDLHIPHPGRVAGQHVLKETMPGVLGWVLGGNTSKLTPTRPPQCRISDRPRFFQESEFPLLMSNDGELERRFNADWLLVAERSASGASSGGAAAALGGSQAQQGVQQAWYGDASSPSTSSSPATSLFKGIYINLATRNEEGSSSSGHAGHEGREQSQAGASTSVLVGSDPNCSLVVEGGGVAPRHASLIHQGSSRYLVQDLGSGSGTWVNGRLLPSRGHAVLHPGDTLEFGSHPAPEAFTVKLQHRNYRTAEVSGKGWQVVSSGAMVQAQ